jgi:hypothetical protein
MKVAMIYEPTVSEEYDLGLCLYYYKCALDAKNQGAAKSQFQRLAKIILKAMSNGRMDSNARAVFDFLVKYPDLYVLVKQFGSGLRDLVFTAHEQAPYGPDAAKALRMYYDR